MSSFGGKGDDFLEIGVGIVRYARIKRKDLEYRRTKPAVFWQFPLI